MENNNLKYDESSEDVFIIDSHCHLNYGKMNNNQAEVVKRANEAGVKGLLQISVEKEFWETSCRIANSYKNVWYSIGQHPIRANTCDDEVSLDDLKPYLNDDKLVAIGECGLDYYHEGNYKKQAEIFHQQINLAQTTSLPIIVHNREADNDVIDILSNACKEKEVKGVFHCFSGDLNTLTKVLDLGFYISASGIVTFKNAKKLQDVFKHCPLDRMLLETDSPYLSPTPMRGKDNYPEYTKYVAIFLAELLQKEYCDIAKNTTTNFFKLFNKATMKY